MTFRRFSRVVLLVQYVLFLPFVWQLGWPVAVALRHGGVPPGCCESVLPELLLWLPLVALGVVSVSGLFTGRAWARWPYIGFAVIFWLLELYLCSVWPFTGIDLWDCLSIALALTSVFIVAVACLRPQTLYSPSMA